MLLAIGLFFFATQLQLMVCQSTVQNNMVAVRFTDVSPQSESKVWKKQIYKVLFYFFMFYKTYFHIRLQDYKIQQTDYKLQNSNYKLSVAVTCISKLNLVGATLRLGGGGGGASVTRY